MTVMNNTFNYTATFSTTEIVAARNAFLQYDFDKQVALLTVMPIDESMGVMHHCSVVHVQHLLEALREQGHQRQADDYAHRLGLVSPEESFASRLLDTYSQHRKTVIAVSLFFLVSGVMSYLSVFVFA
ncbi:hypothetical protein [Salinivibrio sp. ES.052]|uniref:hypothetical protein n=1 Tax=Salinivibrio sp. ES.052 TaxID=1882823 RepID=UPI00092CC155|nr:hypothetical protein [Salinivibrio sp. ES.052]SIO36712.1 hypothetical protein SAMN05444724_3028 [Salinivibrio sp. ES.052]